MNIYELGKIEVGPVKVMVNTVLELVNVDLKLEIIPTEAPLTNPMVKLLGVGVLKDAGSAIPEKTS